MKFINRKAELEFLQRRLDSSDAEMIILYGRRRIGKTELVIHFAKDKQSLYFLGRLESREDTIKRFNALLVERFSDTTLLTHPLPNWDGLFDYLSIKADNKLLVVIDEFPFIVERFPEILSTLQDHWDRKLKDTQIKLILTGSSVSMMEKFTLDYQSPLYGRRTGQWKLDGMDMSSLHEFFPNYTLEERILAYAVLDMIPGYLARFSPDQPLMGQIIDKMLKKGGFFYDEVEFLLREELRDPANYMSILSAIAGGISTFSEIHQKTQLDKSLLSKYLHVLEQLGMVEKKIPVTQTLKSKLKAKGALYCLKDNFFDFWFQFIYLNNQTLESGNAHHVVENLDRRLNPYLSFKFEKFTASALPHLDIAPWTHIGKWWNKQEEIDVVALDENKNKILFAECKWQQNVDAPAILAQLKEKARLVDWKNDQREEHYAVFAKSFKRKTNAAHTHCFDLEDLEKALQKAK